MILNRSDDSKGILINDFLSKNPKCKTGIMTLAIAHNTSNILLLLISNRTTHSLSKITPLCRISLPVCLEWELTVAMIPMRIEDFVWF